MRFQTLLFGVRFFTFLSLVAWLGVLFAVDPETSGPLGTTLFLGTAFSFLAGAFTVLLTALSRKVLGDASAALSFGGSFRQGFLIALFVVLLLLLSRFHMLAWWTAALLFVAILLIELSVRRIGREE